VTLRLARIKPTVRELLRRDDALDRIGAERIHGDVDQAVTAQMIATDIPESDLGKKTP
jgi:sulfate permease, SulP family